MHFPLQAAGTAAQRTLWGYMGSCTDWPTSSADYGFMAFTAGASPTFSDLLVDAVHTMSPNGGGALHDGLYDAVHYVKEENMLKVTHYQFSTDGKWHSTIVPTLVSDPTLIATETASSRATGKVYGQFYNNALSGFEFGVIDYDAMERTTIAESQHKYVALGVTSYEVVYGVATDGNLYRIDTETGEERLIGATGVSVAESSRQSYGQSGEIDQDDDVFYWACIDKDKHAALYTVDLASGAPPSLQTCPTTSRSSAWASPMPRLQLPLLQPSLISVSPSTVAPPPERSVSRLRPRLMVALHSRDRSATPSRPTSVPSPPARPRPASRSAHP